MEKQGGEKSAIQKAGEDLFNFAVDREDVKELVAGLPESAGVEATAVEYELPLLKIITVGWSAAYLMENSQHRQPFMNVYWNAVRDFSRNLSDTAGLVTGSNVDYFAEIKKRFDSYLAAMNRNPECTDPTAVIGPEFAEACGNRNDVFAVLAGSRMFASALNCVREYLKAFSII